MRFSDMEIVVECPCLFFVSKIRANTAKHLLEKMLEMGNAKGNWPMNNRLNFFKRLTAFLLAMLLVTTMMGDDFFSLATSDEIITEESVETGDSSSAPEAAPAPEAVDIPHESAAEEQQTPAEPGQVVEPTTNDAEIPTEPQPTVDENGNPVVVPTENQPSPETPAEPKESIDDAEVTPNPENIDKPETDKTNEEDIEDPDAKDKEEGIDDEETEDEEELVKEEEEECEHEWKYVSNGNGTHFRKCSKCDEEGEQEDCDYDENGVCLKCGYEDNSLVFQTFSKEILGTTVTVEGEMPRNADVTIYYVGKKAIENIVNDSLDEGVFKAYAAYDITIYDRYGNKYQPDYDNNAVKVTFESVNKLDEVPDEDVTVFRIEDDYSVTEIEADASGEDVSFDAEHFSIYVTGEVSTSNYYQFANYEDFGYIAQTTANYTLIKGVSFNAKYTSSGQTTFTARLYKNLKNVYENGDYSSTANPTNGELLAEQTDIFQATAAGEYKISIDFDEITDETKTNYYITQGTYYSVVITMSNSCQIGYGGSTLQTFKKNATLAFERDAVHNGIFVESVETETTISDDYTIQEITATNAKADARGQYHLVKGDTDTLKAVFANKSVERVILWTSSDSNVVSVDSKGNITAGNPGQATISAVYNSNPAVTVTINVFDIKIGGQSTYSIEYQGKAIEPEVTIEGQYAGSQVSTLYEENEEITDKAHIIISYKVDASTTYTYDRYFKITPINIANTKDGKNAFTDASFKYVNGDITEVTNVNTNNVLSVTPALDNGDFTVTVNDYNTDNVAGINCKITISANDGSYFTGSVNMDIIITGSDISDNYRVELVAETWKQAYYKGEAYELTPNAAGDGWNEVKFYENGVERKGIITPSRATAKIVNVGTTTEDATNAGAKTIVFTMIEGQSGYTGSISVPFNIRKASLRNTEVVWKTGKGTDKNEFEHKEDNSPVTVTKGVDFDLVFSDTKKVVDTTEYDATPTSANLTDIGKTVTISITNIGNNFDDSTSTTATYKIIANYAYDMRIRIVDEDLNTHFGIKSENYKTDYEKQYDGVEGDAGQPEIHAYLPGVGDLSTSDVTIKVYDDTSGSTLTSALGTKYIKVTPTAEGNYKDYGAVTGTYQVVARNLSNGVKVTKSSTANTKKFVGTDVVLTTAKPGSTSGKDITVKYGDTVLTEGVDYEIKYVNNYNVGQATYSIEGINNFTGKLTNSSYKFTIKAATLSGTTPDAIATLIASSYNKVYDGTDKEPEVLVSIGVQSIEKNDPKNNNLPNYELSYSDNKSTGKGKITVTGKNNLSGSVVVEFEITSTQEPFKLITLDGTSAERKSSSTPGAGGIVTHVYDCPVNVPYTGGYYNGILEVYGIDTITPLRAGVDYAYEFNNNMAAKERVIGDTATSPHVKITGLGKYANNNAIVYFSITKTDLSTATNVKVTYTAAQAYTGTDVVINDIKVMLGENELTQSTDGTTGDYVVVYNATDKKIAGEKTFTIKGINNYTGELTWDYTVGTNLKNVPIEIVNSQNTTEVFVAKGENTSSETNPYRTVMWRGNKAPKINLYGKDDNPISTTDNLFEITETRSIVDADNPDDYIARKSGATDSKYNQVAYKVKVKDGVDAEGYYGNIDIYYEIQPQPIKEGGLIKVNWKNSMNVIRYDGSNGEYYPEFEYTYGDSSLKYTLVGGKDFVPNPVNLGTVSNPTTNAERTVYGVGNFTSSIEMNNINYLPGYVNVVVKWNDESTSEFSTENQTVENKPGVYKYDGTPKKPDVKLYPINSNAADTVKPLIEGVDYTISWPGDQTTPDVTKTITINIIGENYVSFPHTKDPNVSTDTDRPAITITYTIASNKLSECYGTLDDFLYTANPITMDVVKTKKLTVYTSEGGEKLIEGTDYEIVTSKDDWVGINAQYGTNYDTTSDNMVITESLPSVSNRDNPVNYVFVKGINTYSGYCKVPFNILLPINDNGLSQLYFEAAAHTLDDEATIVPVIKYKSLGAPNAATYDETIAPVTREMVDVKRTTPGEPGPDAAITVTAKAGSVLTGSRSNVTTLDNKKLYFRGSLADLADQGKIYYSGASIIDYTGKAINVNDFIVGIPTEAVQGDAGTGSVGATEGDYTITYEYRKHATDTKAPAANNSIIEAGTYYIVIKGTTTSKYFNTTSDTGEKLTFAVKHNLAKNTTTVKFVNPANRDSVITSTPYTGTPFSIEQSMVVTSVSEILYNYGASGDTKNLIDFDNKTVTNIGTYDITIVPNENAKDLVYGEKTVKFKVDNVQLSTATFTLYNPYEPDKLYRTNPLTYNGGEIEPIVKGTITVNSIEKELNEGTDFTVTYYNNDRAGTASIGITGLGSYKCDEFVPSKGDSTFEIKKLDLENDPHIEIEVDEITYAGHYKDVTNKTLGKVELKPGYTVYYVDAANGIRNKLKEQTSTMNGDYKNPLYENNTDAALSSDTIAPPTLTVKAGDSNNTTGERKQTFTIKQLNLADTNAVEVAQNTVEFTGSDIDVSSIVKLKTNYTYDTTEQSNLPVYLVQQGADADLDAQNKYDYEIAVTKDGQSYGTKVKDAGTYTITLTGKNGCTGKKETYFTVTPRSLENNYHYYYDNGENPGWKGYWNYDTANTRVVTYGEIKTDTTTTKEALTIYITDIESLENGDTPTVVMYDTGRKDNSNYELIKDKDFTIVPHNNTKSASAEWSKIYTTDENGGKHATIAQDSPYVEITGMGTYSGTIVVPFNIGKNINKLGLKITFTTPNTDPYIEKYVKDTTVETTEDTSGWSYTYNGVEQKPSKIEVKDKDGKTLSVSNYTITYTNDAGDEDSSINAGIKYVVITGKDAYCGTIKQKYQINRKLVSAKMVKTNTIKPAIADVFTNEQPMKATTDGTANSTEELTFALQGNTLTRLTGKSTTTNTAKKYLADTGLMNETEAEKFAGYYFAVYDKSPVEPKLAVTDCTLGKSKNSKALISEDDITFEYSNNAAVSKFDKVNDEVTTYTLARVNVVFKATQKDTFNGGNYYVSAATEAAKTYSLDFIIVTRDIEKDFYVQLLDKDGNDLTDDKFDYDHGNFITPKVKVTNGSQVLDEGDDNDYVVEYKNNWKPGEATIYIHGRNNYRGDKQISFIIQGDISDTRVYYKDDEGNFVEGVPKQQDTGQAIDYGLPRLYLALPVENNVTTIEPLNSGVDYNVYDSKATLSDGWVQYQGIGKYWTNVTDKIEYEIEFNSNNIDVVDLQDNQEFMYTGYPIKPTMKLNVTAADADEPIFYRDYGEATETIITADEDFIKVGSITAKIHYRLGNNEGEVYKTYKITPRPIYDCKVVYTENNRYTGYQIKPSVSVFIVSDEGVKTLEEGTQYTVEYGENIYSLCTLKVTGCCDEITSSKTYFPKINLGAPVNLRTSADGSSVTATWVHDIYSAGEEVEIIKASTNELIALKKIEGTKGTCTFDGLENVTNYIVKIRSYQYIGESKELKYSSDWDNAKQSSVTTGIATSEMSVESNAVGKVTIKWNPDGDVVVYKIYRAESADASDKGTKIAVFPASTGVYTNSNLDKKSPYVSDYWYYIEGYAIINNTLTLVSTSEKMHVTVMQ